MQRRGGRGFPSRKNSKCTSPDPGNSTMCSKGPVTGEEWLRERVQGPEARKAAPGRSQRTLWGITQTSDLYLMVTGNH